MPVGVYACVCKILFGKFHLTIGQFFCQLLLLYLNRSSLLPTQNENISVSMWNEPCSELKVKAGTLQKLVTEILNSALCEDTTCVHNSLGSYRCFTTAKQVLDVLSTWGALLQYPEDNPTPSCDLAILCLALILLSLWRLGCSVEPLHKDQEEWALEVPLPGLILWSWPLRSVDNTECPQLSLENFSDLVLTDHCPHHNSLCIFKRKFPISCNRSWTIPGS
jgi:hypothetical protein